MIGMVFCACSESRYLLILTENFAALPLLQQKLATMKDSITIFGSSFRKDQQFTQVTDAYLHHLN